MAMNRQVGGNHYLKLPMQPFHFTLNNGWDAGSHTILKYISRHRNVEREEAIESLRKAYHIVEIMDQAMREERFVYTALAAINAPDVQSAVIPLSEYIRVNGIEEIEAVPLLYLAFWIRQEPLYISDSDKAGGSLQNLNAAMIKNAIEDILMQRYGVSA